MQIVPEPQNGSQKKVPPAVSGKVHHRSRHRPHAAARDLRFAVAPLVQAHARSVEEDFAAVFHDRKPDLIRRARLGQPRKPIFRAQPVDRRFFHNRLAVRHGMQLAVQAVALDRERAVLRHEIFQRNFLHALVKVFKALRFELRKQNHHALAHPAAEIRLCHRGKVPVKEKRAGLRRGRSKGSAV